MNNRNFTHKELLVQFLSEINDLMAEIETKNKELKKAKDYDEVTQAHNTRKYIRNWIRLAELRY